MPAYDFKCENCDHVFELHLPMSKSNSASKKPCPECGKKTVHRLFDTQAGAVDYNRKPGQDWNGISAAASPSKGSVCRDKT